MNRNFLNLLLRRAAAIMAFAVIWAAILPACAQEAPRTIRVGVYESSGFVALDENRQMTGYGANFMTTLARYANVRYEYVYLPWSECLAGLLDGRIDIVTDARKNAEREKLYDFSVQCIGQIQGAVFVPADMPDIYFNDYEALSKLTVGFEKNALNKTLYEQYAQMHGFTAKTVEYPSTADLRAALENGEIDAFGGDTHVFTDDLKVVSIYNTDPNYIMAKKDSAVMRRLNLAIERMYTEHPEMIAEQYSYLVQRQVYGKILLTREDAAYIQRHPVLRVAVFANRKPASWYDAEAGAYRGIAIEVMEKFSEITGIQFEYVRIDDDGYSTNALLKDGVDLAMPVIGDAYYTGSVPAHITQPLYSLSVAIAFQKNRLLNQDGNILVALTKSNEGIKTMLSARYPAMRFALYDTTQDCIAALHAGKVDAYGNAIYELEYHLKNPRNEDLRIAYSYSCPIDYCLAVSSSAPGALISILEGGISLLPDDEIEQIIRESSTFLQYDQSFSDRLYANRHMLFGAGAVILFILIAWLGYYHIQKKAMQSIQRKEEESRAAASEARRANAAKSDFLARVSHDMRTPMNGILGFAALAKDKTDLTEIQEDLRQIENEGNYLLRLINDTLDMSRLENQCFFLNKQPADSARIIENTLNLIEDYARSYDVKIEVEQHDIAQGMVLIDAVRVKQIILHLVSNAVKFSPKGGVVQLYGECYEKHQHIVRDKFVVRDHGIGISPEFLPKAFEPFEQENRAENNSRIAGSGLGLSIVKRLVDLMGGRIEMESELGLGTSVSVYLDFELCPENAVVAEDHPDSAAALKGIRALICEDNEVNTAVLKGCLNRAGCIVDCAANGEIGLRLFEKSKEGYYDVVLMDIRMPVMDGIEATKAIRSLDRADAKDVPILAVTANTYAEDVKSYFASGMNGCIAKPIIPQKIVNMIKTRLSASCLISPAQQ